MWRTRQESFQPDSVFDHCLQEVIPFSLGWVVNADSELPSPLFREGFRAQCRRNVDLFPLRSDPAGRLCVFRSFFSWRFPPFFLCPRFSLGDDRRCAVVGRLAPTFSQAGRRSRALFCDSSLVVDLFGALVWQGRF